MSQYGYNQELDFNGARADLDSVLQNIVAKANAGEESQELEKEADEPDSGSVILSQQDKTKGSSSDVDSPRKAGVKSARKRRRKEDINKEEKHKANSCVMKLFDRSVDLAQFSEDTPLYPICRAWMANDPKEKTHPCADSKNNSESALDSGFTTTSTGSTVVPPPDKPFDNFRPNGTYVSPRIPSPQPQPKDTLDSYLQTDKATPRAETLLLNHLQHWKLVREKWRKKSIENEARYETGMNMMKEMASRPLFTSLPS